MSDEIIRQALASVLTRILDAAPYSGRRWASLLGVTPAAVSWWRSGTSVPSPENLRGIIDLSQEFLSDSAEPIKAFYALFPRSLSEIANVTRFTGTLGEYFVSPVFETFQRLYRELSTSEKERVLNIASDICHYPNKPHLRLSWPRLAESVAPELREILFGLSEADAATQQRFLDRVRGEYFRTVLGREDPLTYRDVSGADAPSLFKAQSSAPRNPGSASQAPKQLPAAVQGRLQLMAELAEAEPVELDRPITSYRDIPVHEDLAGYTLLVMTQGSN